MGKETVIQNNIRLDISNPNVRVFRNDNGTGYGYNIIKNMVDFVKRKNKQLGRTIENMIKPGFIKYGFGEGTHDLIGIKKIKITPNMVGKEIGVFFSIEVKEPNHNTKKDRLEKQINFMNTINHMGGISGFAFNSEEANTILQVMEND